MRNGGEKDRYVSGVVRWRGGTAKLSLASLASLMRSVPVSFYDLSLLLNKTTFGGVLFSLCCYCCSLYALCWCLQNW